MVCVSHCFCHVAGESRRCRCLDQLPAGGGGGQVSGGIGWLLDVAALVRRHNTGEWCKGGERGAGGI